MSTQVAETTQETAQEQPLSTQEAETTQERRAETVRERTLRRFGHKSLPLASVDEEPDPESEQRETTVTRSSDDIDREIVNDIQN